MAAPKFFKDLVLYNINGRTINIPTFVNVKGGNYKYILKLNELSQLVGFSAIDFNTLERALVQKVNQPKLGFILVFNLEGHSNRVELQITLRHGVKLTDDNKISAPQTNQGALMSEIETVVQEIQRDKLKSQSGQPTPAPQQTAAKWKVGDIVFHKNQILDITELAEIVKVDSNEYTYKTNQYDAKYSKIVSIEYKESVDTFDKNSSEIIFNLNDRFSINTGNGYETVIVNSVQGNIVKLVYKKDNRVYAYGNYQFVIKDLFKDASVIWLNTKKVKNLPSTPQTPQQTATKFKVGDYFLINEGSDFGFSIAKVSLIDSGSIFYSFYEDRGGYAYEIQSQEEISVFEKDVETYPLDLAGGYVFTVLMSGLITKVRIVKEPMQIGFRIYLVSDNSGEKINIISNEENPIKRISEFLFSNAGKIDLKKFHPAYSSSTTQFADTQQNLAAKENTPQAFEEQEVEALNKDIAQLMFFKSILSPIDFEKKIEISQEITKKQKRVNDLNFYMLEKRFKSDNIFEDLFEQSFTPINNVYTGVYTPNPEDTDFFTPNGKKSELSDALNVMIRTPQFKAWFGDWELAYLYKDTDAIEIECSKVLTENYEPLVVWHGTGQEFSYFKFDTFPAAYFAVRREYSQFFADLHGGGEGFVIPFFLNIRNPLDLTHFKTNDVSVKDFFDYIFLQTGLDMDDLEVNPIFMDSSLKPLQTWIFIRNNPNMLKKIAQLNIFDGIHFYETNPNIKDKSSPAYETEAYITFNANQSKIADPNRGMILLASMKSFILEKGGAI